MTQLDFITAAEQRDLAANERLQRHLDANRESAERYRRNREAQTRRRVA